MKKLLLLMILLMTSFIGISQDLMPRVQRIENKKHYCFTVEQSREIAKLLELGRYNEVLVERLSENVKNHKKLIVKKDSILSLKTYQLQNANMITLNNRRSIQLLEENIKRKDKRIKRSKLHKLLLGVGLVALGTLIISK